ncbi:MAG TPA: MBL fold metallo-hydrolase [Gemmatimonadaceae bacterium]|nr:MBL fold metallo-hydrolase [Gemmatimonadaceae bacterium]
MCRSTDSRDKRTRVGALVETDGGTNLLIDTPPELRLQLIAAGVNRVDAILFTHDHADHVHGIDDIRALSDRSDLPIDMYGPPDTMERLARRFAYIFDDSIKALPGTSKPEGRAHPVAAGQTVRIGDVDVLPVAVPHGSAKVYGYRIGKLGYITDAKELPDEAVSAFRGVSVLVLNALFRTSHPTHLSVSEAVAAAKKVGARQTWLTHLTHRTGHAELEAELPPGIAPAFDGLTVQID